MPVLNMPNIKTEEQFGDAFIGSRSIKKISTSNSFYVAKELRTPLGVPDYVILSDFDYEKLKLFANKYPDIQLNGKYAAVVSYISKNQGSCVDSISELFHEKRTPIMRALERLEEWGVIDFSDCKREYVKINSSFKLPELRSIAIELKLTNWEKALWQAIRNRNQFAFSYVVMPNAKLSLLKSKGNLFASNNINIAVFDVDKMELTHIAQNKTKANFYNRHYIENLGIVMKSLPSFEKVEI